MRDVPAAGILLVCIVAATAAARWLDGLSLAVVLLGVGGSAVWIASRLSHSLTALRDDARALSRGALGTAPATGSPLVRDVRESLNALAESSRLQELTLEREQADLDALMNRMDEGVLALDVDGTLRVANRAARAILGVPEELRTPHLSQVARRELRAVLEASLQTSMRPRELNVDDRVILTEANLLEDGAAIVSLRDVTNMRRLEEVRTDFVANASHELKTPLTAVRGFAETLLEDDPPTDVQKQFLRLIYDNTLRLQAIVEDLLDLSRLESGGWTPESEPLDVAAAARQAWDEVVETRGSDRGFDVSGAGLVLADRRGLRHILYNLLDNALRYTDEEGRIRVHIFEETPERTRITVEDDGAGIPPDALPRIFERFFRVDKARSRAQGGTGLGLAIVSHMASRMGGTVGAESQFGVGTKIHVFLPAVP